MNHGESFWFVNFFLQGFRGASFMNHGRTSFFLEDDSGRTSFDASECIIKPLSSLHCTLNVVFSSALFYW